MSTYKSIDLKQYFEEYGLEYHKDDDDCEVKDETKLSKAYEKSMA